jgi:hypothetical protein
MPEPNADELQSAIDLLAQAGPEHQRLLNGRPASGFLKVAEVAELTGVSDHTVRQRAERGEYRGAILYNDVGWRIPWSGVVVYTANQYRQTRGRATGS